MSDLESARGFMPPRDRWAMFVCSILGICTRLLIGPTSWSFLAGMMVSYHLFLVWLVISSDEKTGLSYSIVTTVLVHLGCLSLVVGVRVLFATALREFIHADPQLALITLGFYGIRIFLVLQYLVTCYISCYERDWLFSGGRKPKKAVIAAVAPIKNASESAPQLAPSTGLDYMEWLEYRSRQNKSALDLGSSPKEEFEKWLQARGKSQYVAADLNASVNAD